MNHAQKAAALISFTLTAIIFAKIITQYTQPPAYSDGFEDFPLRWSLYERDGYVTRSSQRAVEGKHSLRIHSPSQYTYAYANTSIPEDLRTSFHLQLWFLADYTRPPDHIYIIELRDSQSHIQERIVATDQDGVCQVAVLKSSGSGYDPKSYTVVCTVSKDSWHKLDLLRDTSSPQYTVMVDDIDYGRFPPRNTTISVEQLYLGDSTGGGFSGLIYLDNLIINPR